MRLRLPGRLEKDGRFWLASIPLLDAMTQGRSRKEALVMVGDLVETMADVPCFRVEVIPGPGASFEIAGDAKHMLAVLLRRRRQLRGRSLADVAQLMGQTSPTVVARYEQGRSVPTWRKFLQLLDRMEPGHDLLLDLRTQQKKKSA